ncbi:hypothetical protein HYU90_00630, partial [Candidatus Collierbacteria bacterium]|nr:hypothetical protein [Candidatus Collierbacteria bacterium]
TTLSASTSITSPTHIGGTGTTSTLALRSTSGVGTTGADILFQVGNNGATEAMRILNNGNVGIGTTGPQSALTLGGSGSIANGLTFGTANTGFYVPSATGLLYFVQGGTPVAQLYTNGIGGYAGGSPELLNVDSTATVPNIISNYGDTDTGIGSATNDILSFIAGGTNVMNITAGNVGIGTTNPTQKLDIVGNLQFSGALLPNGSSGTTGQFLISQGTSAPIWTSTIGATTVPWSGLTSPTGNLALAMSAYTSTFTYGATTGAGVNLFNLTDTASNTGTGCLLNLSTGNSSALHPFRVVAANSVESLMVDTNGYVGIGTTSPADKLSVFGGTSNINIGGNYGSGYNAIWLNGGTATTNYNILSRAADNHLYINRPTGGDINFFENDSSSTGPVVIKSGGNVGIGYLNPGTAKLAINGNVGIGTTSPGAKLQVIGNATIGGTGAGDQLLITNPATNTVALSQNNAGAGGKTLRIGTGGWSTDSITFGKYDYAGTEFMNISGTGQINIGGTAALTSPNMTILTTGNVGIGTTNPAQKLDVVGNLQFSQALLPNGSSGTTGQFLISGGTGSPTWTSTVGASTVPFSGITSGTNTTASMIVDTGASINYANSGTINASSLVGATWVAPGAIGSTTPNTAAFTTLSSTSNTFLATSTGNVGVGTTAPGTKLDVLSSTGDNVILSRTLSGSGSNAGFELRGGATSADWFIGTNRGDITANADDLFIYKNAGTTGAKVTIQDGGNVGIGTTNPISKLQVNGDIRIPSGNRVYFDNTNDYNYFDFASGTLNMGYTVDAFKFDMNTSGTKTIEVVSDSNFRILGKSNYDIYLTPQGTGDVLISAGNVGIGTTNPTQKLDIVGNLQFSQALLPNGSSGTTGQFLISGGTGSPTWTSTVGASTVPFSGITSGTNTTASMIVDTGASLNYANSGTINASSLVGATWVAPGTIGSTTPNTGAFTTLSSTSNTFLATTTGNVGIGTTAPVFQLQVHNSEYSYLHLTNTDSGNTTSDGFTIGLATDENGIIWLREATNLRFGVGGAEKVRIDNSGNVGIGTTNPTQKLDVVGNLQFSGALLPNGSSGTTGQFLISQGTSAPTWTSTVGASTVPFSGITSGTNTTASMVIGTGAALTYSGTGTNNASSLVGATWVAPGTIGSTTPNTGAFTTLSSTSNTFLATTTGNVGIGTTAPGATLHIAKNGGTIRLSTADGSEPTGYYTEAIQSYTNTINSVPFAIRSYQGGGVSLGNILSIVSHDGSAQYRTVLNGLTQLRLQTAGTDKVTIDNSGNVGIGTTSPTSLLSLGTSLGKKLLVYDTGSVATSYGFGIQNNLFEISGATSTSDFTFGYGTSGSLTRLMTILGSGNVGIGTTNPGTKLNIIGTVAAPANSGTTATGVLRVDNNGNIAMDMGAINSSPYPAWIQVHDRFDQSVNYPLSLQPNGGNVGIGTTAPSAKLHISGDMRLTGALYDVNNGVGTSGQVLSSTVTGVDWVDISSIGIGGSGTTNYLPKFTAGTTLGNSVLYETSGNVGIGTTAPLSKLGILGSASVGATYGSIAAPTSGMIIEGNVGIGTTGPSQKLEVAGVVFSNNYFQAPSGLYDSANGSYFVDPYVASGNSIIVAGNVGIGTTSPTAGYALDVRGNVQTNGYYCFWNFSTSDKLSVEGTNSVYLQGNTVALKYNYGTTGVFLDSGGNVGIGKTNPAQALDVVGNLQFSQALLPNGSSGTTGQFLISGGTGSPTWTSTVGASTVPFSGITSGTNTTASMIVDTGASINYANSGTINASSLVGATWVAPGTIGSTTPNTGAFTTLSSTGNTFLATSTGNVGIGTTAPLSKLGIKGAGATSATSGLNVTNSSDTSALFVRDDGYVGIGTTTPVVTGTKFEQTATFTDAATESNVHLQTLMAATGANVGGTSRGTTIRTLSSGSYNFTGTLRSLEGAFWNNGTGTVTNAVGFLFSGGTFSTGGITDLKNIRLETYSLGAGGTVATITGISIGSLSAYNSPTTTYGIKIDDSTNAIGVSKYGLHIGNISGASTNNFSIYTGTAKTYLGGNVGIGTTAPTQALDIVGNLQFSGALLPNGSSGTTGQFLISGGTGSPTWTSSVTANALKWNSLTSPDGNLALAMSAYTSTFTYGATTGAGVNLFNLTDTANNTGTGYLMNLSTGNSSALNPFRVVAANGVEALMVKSNGNVGIGTTSPGAKLDVAGSINLTSATANINVNSSGAVGDSNAVGFAGSRALVGYDGVNGVAYLQGASAKSLALQTNGANTRLFIDTTGNVGIGTTSPASLLDVAGTAWLRGVAGGTSGLFVNSSGNVGVGTTAPSQLLQIYK